MTEPIYLDAISAYNCIASEFTRLSDRRRAYLTTVEQLITSEIPSGNCSLLDIGSGDGTRALRIATSAGLRDVVLLEPSAKLRKAWPTSVSGWPIRAEELGEQTGSFDVITCLWNVLGHVSSSNNRVHVLRQCARLLSPGGLLFIDVNYRYNALHYGFAATAYRMLYDRASPSDKNGDVLVPWNVDGVKYLTNGHVFTHAEFSRIAQAAGLTVYRRFSINYATGKIQKSPFAGNLLYVLRRAPSDLSAT